VILPSRKSPAHDDVGVEHLHNEVQHVLGRRCAPLGLVAAGCALALGHRGPHHQSHCLIERRQHGVRLERYLHGDVPWQEHTMRHLVTGVHLPEGPSSSIGIQLPATRSRADGALLAPSWSWTPQSPLKSNRIESRWSRGTTGRMDLV
jgi:hypothetical protein